MNADDVLVAIPLKKSLNEKLRERMNYLSGQLNKQTGMKVVIYENEPIVEEIQGRADYVFKRSMNLCHARNLLLEKYLKPEHRYVLWIDADIVDYPPDLAYLLFEKAEKGIVAPMILIEGTEEYYDTYTHIDYRGNSAKWYKPYFDINHNLIPMSCVGGCYLIPARIHRAAKYTPYGGPGMEHLNLMKKAMKMGFPIYVSRQVVVYHAQLPKWGEAYH